MKKSTNSQQSCEEFKKIYPTKKFVFGITIKDMVELFLLTFIPFILIILLLQPYTFGVHGEMTSRCDETIIFDGNNTYTLPSERHGSNRVGNFDGDVKFDGRWGFHGWVICNGKISPGGQVTIKNTNFSYEYISENWQGGGGGDSYSYIKFDGDKGDMENGVPYYYFGFIGLFFGLVFWVMRMDLKQKEIRSRFVFYSFLSIWPFIYLLAMSFWMCSFVIPLVFLISIIFLIGMKKRILYKHISNYKQSIFIMGIFLLIFSLIVFIYPIQTSNFTDNGRAPANHIYFGLIGIFMSIYPINIGMIPSKRIKDVFRIHCYYCKRKVRFVSMYKSWFCDNCNIHLQINICKKCDQQMIYNWNIHRWICPKCLAVLGYGA